MYATLATYTTYNDYLSDEAKEDATILIEGGHGWQTTSRLGEMTMGLAYVENMRDLVDQIKNGNWVEEGTDDMTLEELLQEGNLVTKAIDQEMPNVTIYYGTDLSSVAAITTSTEILDEYAGISADNAREEVVTEAVE